MKQGKWTATWQQMPEMYVMCRNLAYCTWRVALKKLMEKNEISDNHVEFNAGIGTVEPLWQKIY